MTTNLCVAQLGSAPTLGVGGRWFESSHADHRHFAAVAQLVEQPLCKRQALGSSPSVGAIICGPGRVVQAAAFQAVEASSILAARSSTSLPGATPGFASACGRGFFYTTKH